MHHLTIPARNRVLRLLGRPEEPDFLCARERELRGIFFHVPKTGGLAICEGLLGGHHVNHRLYVKCERQDPVTLARFWKFCILRDPIRRFLSAFRFLKAGGMSGMDRAFQETHREVLSSPSIFLEAFRERESIRHYVHFRPQADFVCDANGRLQMDFVGRFEQLPRAFEIISRRLGVQADLPEVNRSPKKSNDSLRSDEESFILSYYAKDIQIISRLPDEFST